MAVNVSRCKSLWIKASAKCINVNVNVAPEEHQNDQTQKQFLPSGNPSHEHLTLNVEHTTLLYIIYSPHILIFSFQICTYQTCTHIAVYIIYCVFAILYIAYLYICILLFYYLCPVLLLSSVALWSFCHYNKFLVCVNIPGQ